jgi:phosphoadenosine phosphosulfate reductase
MSIAAEENHLCAEWSSRFRNTDLPSILDYLDKSYPDQIVFTTSFNIEDQVITHFIVNGKYRISLITLDTGRMFQETYYVWSQTEKKYGIKIIPYFPEKEDVEDFIIRHGINGFYESIENRKECCFVRKVKPLRRALEGKKIWITGIRAEQSEYRKNMELFEWDEQHRVIKFNPLLYWTKDDVVRHIKENDIPYHPLFDKGYVSIGCAPCTRPVKEGEPYRSGRWWWENDLEGKKECGLHLKRK